jgi:hypothetical protein
MGLNKSTIDDNWSPMKSLLGDNDGISWSVNRSVELSRSEVEKRLSLPSVSASAVKQRQIGTKTYLKPKAKPKPAAAILHKR